MKTRKPSNSQGYNIPTTKVISNRARSWKNKWFLVSIISFNRYYVILQYLHYCSLFIHEFVRSYFNYIFVYLFFFFFFYNCNLSFTYRYPFGFFFLNFPLSFLTTIFHKLCKRNPVEITTLL